MKNDLKHLRRSELIDLIYEMKKREIELQTRLDEAEAKLQAGEITMKKAGTIADAAVELSGVFQAAQEAADTYLKSIKAKEKELSHCVLSGHRGLPSAKLFTDLDKLEKGDIFLLHIYDKVLTYEIDQISIVEPEDYGLLEIEDGKDLCTLLTCTPYGINTQRLLVRGHRIENRSGDNSRVTSDAAEVSSLTVAVCVAIPLLIISFLVVDLSIRRSRKKQKK